MAKLPLFTAPQTSGEGDFRWFVYGSSLDGDAFAAWCREHGYQLPEGLARAARAVLPGWRLAFNVRSNFWGGRVASLVEDPARSVEGIAVPMPASALGMVRHKEGVVSGLYEERAAACRLADGTEAPCKVFVAAAARLVPEGPPSPQFLETLVRGARAHGLSPAWLAKLEQTTGSV